MKQLPKSKHLLHLEMRAINLETEMQHSFDRIGQIMTRLEEVAGLPPEGTHCALPGRPPGNFFAHHRLKDHQWERVRFLQGKTIGERRGGASHLAQNYQEELKRCFSSKPRRGESQERWI